MCKAQGFTLIELLATVCVVSLILAAGVPSFANLLERHRLLTAASTLMRSLQFARTTAVLHHRYVCVANYNDSWRGGWHIFEDDNRNCIQDDEEHELISNTGLSNQINIIPTGSARRHVLYSPDGQSEQLSGAFQADSIYLCPHRPEAAAYRIVISRGGRVRSEETQASATPCPG